VFRKQNSAPSPQKGLGFLLQTRERFSACWLILFDPAVVSDILCVKASGLAARNLYHTFELEFEPLLSPDCTERELEQASADEIGGSSPHDKDSIFPSYQN